MSKTNEAVTRTTH